MPPDSPDRTRSSLHSHKKKILWETQQGDVVVYDLHLHLVIWQTLLSEATYNWGIHKAIHLEEAIRRRKCS